MAPLKKIDRFVRLLKSAYAIRGPLDVPDDWERRVLRDVAALNCRRAEQLENESWSLFLRLGFAVCLVTLLVHATYRVSDIEETVSANSMMQLDPFNVWGSFNG